MTLLASHSLTDSYFKASPISSMTNFRGLSLGLGNGTPFGPPSDQGGLQV